MRHHNDARATCPVCGKERPLRLLSEGEMVRPAITDLITRDHPEWTPTERVCQECLDRYRGEYVEDVLEEEKGALSALDQEVVQSLREHELLSQNLNTAFDRRLTLGERLADRVAAFGGSWGFLTLFGVTLVVWMGVNTVGLLRRPFDPYPFILLNLVLSCLAAVQAPGIMMSQNRQEAKDRLRAENDYRVNLKAELEIRHLNEKLDLLLNHQWRQLLEIQRIQLDLMREVAGRSRPDS